MSQGAARHAVVALLASSLLGAAGCEQERPLAIESDEIAGFDPLRFDFGPEPAGALDEGRALRFSSTPFYTPGRQRQMLDPMRAWLEEKVGVVVEASVSASYASTLSQLASGELDVAQLSPYACVQAEEDGLEVERVATAVAQGTTTYASYLVARADSAIERITDAKGKRLALTEPWSASGFLYPWAWLRKQGLVPERDFELVFISKQDQALEALLAGKVDLVAVSSDALVSRDVLGLGGPVRIVAKAGRIPYDCIVVRKALGERLVWRVRKAFLALSILTPEGREVLRDYNLINGFIPPPKGYYDDVKALHATYGAEVAAVAARLPLHESAPAHQPKEEP